MTGISSSRPLGWVTLEEAQQLVEAGLPTETADMYYWLAEGKEYVYVGKCPDPNGIPCWSLGALMQLLPRTIEQNYDLFINLEFWVIYRHPISKEIKFVYGKSSFLIENVKDAIVQFLNNKLL